MGDTQRDESDKRMPQHYACNTSPTEVPFPNLVPDATEVPVGDLAIIHNSSSPHSKTHSVISDSTIQAEDMHQETYQRRVQVPCSTTAELQGLEVDSRSRRSPSTLLAFVALCLSIFLVALDTVLIPTALPTIALSFQVSDSLYAWIGSAYLLTNAASVPFWGKVSDIFGRKSVILAAETIFLAGSIICALSSNAVMLIAGRAVQGFGGGGVVVLVHVCVSDLFPIRDRSFYLGLVGAVWAVASALGPVLGGIFAEQLGWRYCFWVNVPLVCTSIITLYATLHLHNPRIPLLNGLASLDWLGITTILVATVLLLVGLQLGCATSYVMPLVVALIVLGSLMHVLFPLTQWWQEKKGVQPVFPLRIFKDVSNLSALGVCAADALVFNSVAYFLPLYFQMVLGQSPSASGIYMLAIAVPLATISFASGYLINRTGRYVEVLQGGLFLMTLGVGLLISLKISQETGKIIAILLIVGVGFGPNFGAPLIALQTRIDKSDIATGTAAFGFVRMIFGAFGVVIGQVVVQLLMTPHFENFVNVGIAQDVAGKLARGEAISLARKIASMPVAQKLVVRGAMMGALKGTWIFYTVVSALGLAGSFGIERAKLQRDAECEAGDMTSSEHHDA